MATQAQPRTRAKRILVVEDELMIRLLLEDMLSELGYTVAAEAARMDEALEATKNADFDLAILDARQFWTGAARVPCALERLVRDCCLGVRRVGRVLLDAANEI
jgi:DNA-binding NarL/FixJ family response regulator